MNVVFIIPTGLGCTIGGHAGDATPAAKLIAQTCDKLILHPNVVNASDINEMPANALYVEGSILDEFLRGATDLREVTGNRVLLAVNKPLKHETMNAVNAAMATVGMHIETVELNIPLVMHGYTEGGLAMGSYSGVQDLIDQVHDMELDGVEFDALGIASPIDVDAGVALDYFMKAESGVNPWGAVEATVSRLIASAVNKPVAHAPVECDATKGDAELMNILYEQTIDPRKAAEVCSSCYIHCVLKGLHTAPRMCDPGTGIGWSSIGALVTPVGCVGLPHLSCFEKGIPVIGVKENTTGLNERDDRIIYVENYLEAAGVIECLDAGITPKSVRA